MRYLVRRLALLVPTLFVVLVAVFVLVRVVPGDVVSLLLADQNVTREQAVKLRQELGLNDSLPVQFAHYLGDLLRGDFGKSIWSHQSVLGELKNRLPVTGELTLFAALFSLLLALPVGVLSAVKQNSWADYLCRALAIGGLSLPGFWLGTLAIVLPSIWWHYTPPLRYISPLHNPWANLREFVVPAAIMSLYLSAVLMRMTRSTMLEVLRQDYVRTARAKGLREWRVIGRHALRTAFIPIVTMFGVQCAALIGGTVIYESIFNLKGIGSYMFDAVGKRDYPVIQSVNVILAVGVLLINLAVDISYTALDPRIRTGGS
jgi:peptide/nickel transport system permease protein